jgi:hypothetical protein
MPTEPEPKEEELAKKLSNPMANLISVPFQYNYDKMVACRSQLDYKCNHYENNTEG